MAQRQELAQARPGGRGGTSYRTQDCVAFRGLCPATAQPDSTMTGIRRYPQHAGSRGQGS